MTKRLARHLPFLAWSALAFTVLFWRLGAASFWDPDEARYAQTTRELITTGNWLTPYYNDQPFFDKPILFHWLQAVPMAILGSTETAARLVPAVAALAIVGLTWWLGAALVSSEVGFVAALPTLHRGGSTCRLSPQAFCRGPRCSPAGSPMIFVRS